METKTFTYGGYTFEPRGQFADYGIMPGRSEMRQICSAIHYPNSGYVADGTDMYVFRADLLQDITDDMAPMNGQERIETGMYLAIENAWDACEGLYANPKEV